MILVTTNDDSPRASYFSEWNIIFKDCNGRLGSTELLNGKKYKKSQMYDLWSLSKKMICEPTIEVQLYRYK